MGVLWLGTFLRWAGPFLACRPAACPGRFSRSVTPAVLVVLVVTCVATFAVAGRALPQPAAQRPVLAGRDGGGVAASAQRAVRRQRAPWRAVPPVPQARPCILEDDESASHPAASDL